MKAKKIPTRMCAACSEHKPKSELIRIVKSPEGEISVDFTGKKSGRGAYICNDVHCLKKLQKSKRLERTFSCSIPEEVYLKLEEAMQKGE